MPETQIKSNAAGYSIGTTAAQLVGFHGSAPVAQAATSAAVATAALTVSGSYTEAEVTALATRCAALTVAVNALLVAVKNKGLMASA